MKINSQTIELLFKRIQSEEFSSRLYKQMSLYLKDIGLAGLGALWASYASEEMNHAKWAEDFLLAHGIKPVLKDLPPPTVSVNGFLDIVNLSYEHEVKISMECNDLAKHAQQIGDHMLYTLALKYCAEQIEELDKLQNFKDIISTFGDNAQTILFIEQQQK